MHPLLINQLQQLLSHGAVPSTEWLPVVNAIDHHLQQAEQRVQTIGSGFSGQPTSTNQWC